MNAADLSAELAHIMARAHAAAAPRIAEVEARRAAEAAAANDADQRDAGQVAKHARLARLAAAGVPNPLIAALDKPLAATPVLTAARAWRASSHRTLVLAGNVGVGKSLAAAWLLERGPRRGYLHANGFVAATWPDALAPRWALAGRLARLSIYARDDADQLDTAERCALLVIDDVGGHDAPPSWAARFDGLVCARADAGLDTIITTNLSLNDFTNAFGERITDRMRGDGRCWVSLGGPSLRASSRWQPPLEDA